MASLLIQIMIHIALFILSSVPLYLAVKILGGKTSILKTAFIAFIAGIVVLVIQAIFRVWGALIAFIALIWIFHEAFRLKWWKAFLVWILYLVIVAAFYFILALFGIILAGISLLSG